MEEAKPANQSDHKRGDCADKFVDVRLHPQAPPKRSYAACHTDNKPMSLLCTLGTTKEPSVPQIRTRAYRDSDGVLQNFVGQLRQPGAHQLYRTKFNGVDNSNKLALSPGSCVGLTTKFENVRVFLAFLAMAETNAFLAYQQVHGLTSDQYSHSGWRQDVVEALLGQLDAAKGDTVVGEVAGVDGSASVPPEFDGHW